MNMKQDFMKEVSENITIYRKKKGLTLNELADKAGIPFSTLRTLVYAGNSDCKLSTVVYVANALEINVDELIGNKRGD